jgi:transposase
MTVTLRDAGDREKLKELVASEKHARQRDRYRCVLLAMDDLEGDEIAQRVGRSPRFVDEWAGRYRYHLAENVHKGRRSCFGEDHPDGHAWAETVLQHRQAPGL